MPTTVGAARIGTADIPVYLDELGTVTSVQNVVVRSQISGQLLKIGFNEGQMVRHGQVLAQVDPRPYQQQLAQAQGQLARDQAQLANARLDLNRYRTLLTQDSIARQQVDTQAALVRQYEGTLAADQAAVGAAKVNLGYTTITSPVSGRVGLRAVDVGNFVTQGDSGGIVTVTQINPIDVLFTIPQDQLPQVAGRLRSGAVLPASAYDRARVNVLSTGRLLTFDNAVDVNTGTVRAKARFDNAGGALFPSQFVNVRLLVDTLRDAVTAPTGAVLRGQRGQFVYVVDLATRKVSVRPIKTGQAAGEQTAVLDGLRAGEVVVTDGTDRLREGACVILPGDRIPSMGAGGRGGRRGAGAGGGSGGSGAPGGGQAGPGGRGGAGGGRCPNAGKPWAGAPDAGAAASGGRARIAADTPSEAAPAAEPAPDAAAGGAPQGGGRGPGRMIAALGLDPGQQAKAQAIFARHQPSDPEDPEARRDARQAAIQELLPILRPDQKAKLEQFRAQMRQGGGQGGPGQ